MRENLEIRRVKICRGCCCGVKTGQKNGAELREQMLLMLEGHGIEVERTECLGPCDQGDIVVVLPTRSERRKGYKPTWLGRMHSFTLTTLLAELLLEGFFESFEKYPELKERKIQPSRKKKKEIFDVQKYA